MSDQTFAPPAQLEAADSGIENTDYPPPLDITSPQGLAPSSASTTTTSATTGSSKSRQSLSGLTGFGPLRLDVTTPSTTKSTPEVVSVEFSDGFSNPIGVRTVNELSPSNRDQWSYNHGSNAAPAVYSMPADQHHGAAVPPSDDAPTPSNRATTATPHKLGHGASGNVVLMQRLADSKLVAIKRLKAGVDHRDMAKRESNFVRLLLQHYGPDNAGAPYGLLHMFGVFKKDGVTRIIMEYMDHGHAGALAPLPTPVLAAFTAQLLEGLRVLHTELRVIHRDLKPANILVNSEGHVKLADFGVAALLEEGIDHSLEQVGTILQMSPERLRGEPHTYSSDIWALGLTVAELALGYHPFAKGMTQAELAQQTSEDRFWKVVELLAATSPNERCSHATRSSIDKGIVECDPIVKAFILRCMHAKASARASIDALFADPFLADMTLESSLEVIKQFLATERAGTRLVPTHTMIEVLPPTSVDLDDGLMESAS